MSVQVMQMKEGKNGSLMYNNFFALGVLSHFVFTYFMSIGIFRSRYFLRKMLDGVFHCACLHLVVFIKYLYFCFSSF